MHASNTDDYSKVNVWYKTQLELRRNYLEMLLERGYNKEQTGFDINEQLKSITKEINDLEEEIKTDNMS